MIRFVRRRGEKNKKRKRWSNFSLYERNNAGVSRKFCITFSKGPKWRCSPFQRYDPRSRDLWRTREVITEVRKWLSSVARVDQVRVYKANCPVPALELLWLKNISYEVGAPLKAHVIIRMVTILFYRDSAYYNFTWKVCSMTISFSVYIISFYHGLWAQFARNIKHHFSIRDFICNVWNIQEYPKK